MGGREFLQNKHPTLPGSLPGLQGQRVLCSEHLRLGVWVIQVDTSAHPKTQSWEINPDGAAPWEHLQPGELDPAELTWWDGVLPCWAFRKAAEREKKNTKNL